MSTSVSYRLLVLSVMSVPSASAIHADQIQLAATPALSPDGSNLAFAWRGQIWTVAKAGGKASAVTNGANQDTGPVYSPDGQRIAFVRTWQGSPQVFVVPASGGRAKQLTFHTAGSRVERWYPDGNSLLVSVTRDHFWRHTERFGRVDLNARAAERILFDAYGSQGSLSPDAKQLLFCREGTRWWRKGYRGSQASQIWLWKQEAGTFAQLVDEPGGTRHPLFKPDGTGFYGVSASTGSFNLWEYDLAGKPLRQITKFEDDSVVDPAMSADGSLLVFRHLFDLYTVPSDGSKPPQRVEIQVELDSEIAPMRSRLSRATEVAFSEDGLDIAFIAAGDLWVMDTELREPRQVTETPESESEPVFSSDGSALYFVSDQSGQTDIWKATRKSEDQFWWQNESFQLERMTEDPEPESSLKLVPGGDRISYVKGRGDLWVMQPNGRDTRRLIQSWNSPQYDWSPDGRWVVYALSDNDFNRDIWVLNSDGKSPAVNISMHPDNDASPVWSPDGKLIAFTGRRVGQESDIYYLWLSKRDEETSSRDRTIKKAIEKMEKVRKKNAAKPAPGAKPDEKPDAPETPTVEIDFDGIHERLHRISIPDTNETALVWSHDSKKLAFAAEVDGKRGYYTVTFPNELTPKLLTTQVGSDAVWISRENQLLWLVNGVPTSVTAAGKVSAFGFTALHEVDPKAKFAAAFDLCWRTMRDRYYDERLGNRNWDAMRRKYRDAAIGAAPDGATLSTVVNLMLGELNGSHLGFFYRGGQRSAAAEWRIQTAHLGVRFDPTHQGPGLKIADVIPGGPAAQLNSRLEPGEVILRIDDANVDPAMDLTSVLNGPLPRAVRLAVRDAEGNERTVSLQAISYSAVRGLLYEKWVDDNAAKVAALSDNRLGYMHIRGMNMTSFYRFERELYGIASGKDGIVIDVRENGGGSTTDHLLTILTQPVHAITVPRGGGEGYPQDRKVYGSWSKPVVVLCNQNSFSNAEIFSHAIKTLGRGKLVGVPTAGGVISTGGTAILDIGFLRIPFRGWFLVGDGEDMELNGAVPDVLVWPAPGDWPSGKDEQLARAVEILSEDVKKWSERPRPKLQKASERS